MIMNEALYYLNGHELLLRSPREEEASMFLDNWKIAAGETPYLIKEPEEITLTLEQEVEFIRRNNESDSSILILGFLDGEYVGNCSIVQNYQKRYLHRDNVGIALYKFKSQAVSGFFVVYNALK